MKYFGSVRYQYTVSSLSLFIYIYIYYLLIYFYFYRSHICKFSYLVKKLKTNLIVKLINCKENEYIYIYIYNTQKS